MLEVENLRATINGREILEGINLIIKIGEVHTIIGPSGSGKSTSSAVLVDNPMYEVAQGEVALSNKDLSAMPPEDRIHEGLFLFFQYPVEIPDVPVTNSVRTAINKKRKYQGQEPMNAGDFIKLMKGRRKATELDSKLSNRSVDEEFSGGEKKRNEVFQVAMLESTLSILDETDSDLDVDALRTVTKGINKLKGPDTSTIVITHYDRLLDLIKPNIVHVLFNGHIMKTEEPELARKIEDEGYDQIKAETE